MIRWMCLLMVGCGYGAVSKESFFDDFAEAQCLAFQSCYKARFDGQYKTMDRCLDEVGEDMVQEVEQLFLECDFQQDQAQICIDLVRQATCQEHWDDEEEIYAACREEVWDCGQAQ